MADDEAQACPNGHASVAGGMCNVASCAHCDPIVKKPSRTGDGKAPDGLASIGSPPRPSRREQRTWRNR